MSRGDGGDRRRGPQGAAWRRPGGEEAATGPAGPVARPDLPRPGALATWRPFRRLAEAQAAHAAGDVLVAVALADTVFFSVPLGEARARVALYLVLTMAPFAVLSPLVGTWIDRRRGSYRITIVAAMAGRTLLCVLLSGRVDRLALYPLAFGLLVLSRVHGVSRSALVPETRPPGRSLMWANAWMAVISVTAGALAAGPALALNHWLGASAVLWTAALAFGTGSLAAMGLPRGDGAAPAARAPGSDARVLLSPRLLGGGVAMASLRGAVGFTTFLLAFLLRGAGEGGRGLAVAAVAAGAGGFLGSALGPPLRSLLRETLLLLAALGLVALAALWAAAGFDVARAAVVAAVVGLASGMGRLAFDSLLQHDAPEQVRARTFARYETVFQVWWVAAAGVATVVPWTPPSGLGALSGLCVLGLLLSLRGLLRR
ncbi:MAG TPA: MFS transporter [Actinomycetes bacterium]|nr:MFS transporter [Actinomycetes bacterium]